MATFNKSDMQYTDYKWTAYGNDDSRISGPPDNTLFSRKEGYEVLYLINHIVDTAAEGKKAERLIHEHLPSDVRSQVNVKKWIRDNWNRY